MSHHDLTIVLDRFVSKNKSQLRLKETIQNLTNQYLQKVLSLSKYQSQVQLALTKAEVQDKDIYIAINLICMREHLLNVTNSMDKFVISNNQLHDNLCELKVSLFNSLESEIQSGKTIKQINDSNILKIANNTADFIQNIYDPENSQYIIQLADQYAKENIRLGRDWNLVNKIIISALIAVSAAVIGCVLGAAIGFAIGFAAGAITGPGAFITALIGVFIGGFKGSMIAAFMGTFMGGIEGTLIAATSVGLATGLGGGIASSIHFFHPSPIEKNIQKVIESVKNEDNFESLETEFQPVV